MQNHKKLWLFLEILMRKLLDQLKDNAKKIVSEL